MALPKSFIDLAAAYNSSPNSFVTIIGVVVDLMAPRTTASGQYMMTFKLLDPRFRDSIYGSQGLTVRFFKADVHSLPQVRQLGDVALLRDIKMIPFQGQPMAMSNYATEVTVFPGGSIPAPTYEIAFQGKQRLECLGVPLDVQKLSLQEQAYVIRLKHDMDDTLQSLPSNNIANGDPTSATPMLNVPTEPAAMRKRAGEELASADPKRSKFGKKFKLIRDSRHRDFADICVQVVKKFPTQFGACELYVTDYTENKDMFYYAPPEEESERERDGDSFGYTGAPKRTWPGPFGWYVLKTNLKDPHAQYANREVEEGDFVLLRNVKMKYMHHVEGDMWPDSLDREKVQIFKLKNSEGDEIKSLLERKDKYWGARNAKLSKGEKQEEKEKLTKTEKKKLKKQKKAEQAAAAANGGKSKIGEPAVVAQNGNGIRKADVNPHIRCSYEEVPITSVRDILDPTDEMHTTTTPDGATYVLPFMNAKYRTRVRVVDFEPKQLEHFAVPEQPGFDDHSEYSPMMDVESSRKYEWSFDLQLENASAKEGEAAENRLWVTVGHKEAEFLFGNDLEDPDDLGYNPSLLAKLRDKLFILWGNLAERSEDQAISNRPFECCVLEYGVAMDEDDPEKASSPFGLQRMYSMFGVTIT